jgi:hypothetical protein
MTPTKNIACVAFVAVLVSLVTCGCSPVNGDGSSSSAMPASAADAQTVQRIREKYFRAYTESQVGVVIATLQGEPFVAVGELANPASMHENEIVTFLDRSERVLTTGTIVRILPDSIHVRYDAAPRSGRTPRRGDVMVRTPAGARTL